MTRTLIFFMAIAAILATIPAVLLRVEMAYPGVSLLFSDAEGNPDGARFTLTVTAHAAFAYLAVMLLGTAMIAAARAQGAGMAAPAVWLGVALCVVLVALMIAAQIESSASAQDGTDFGWILYPPLSTAQSDGLLERLIRLVGVDPLRVGNLDNLLILPAAGLLLMGAFAMLSTEPRLGALPVLSLFVTVVSLIFVGQSLMGYDTLLATSTFHLAFWPLLTFAAIRLIDAAPDWLIVLTLGLLAVMAAHLTIIALPQTDAAADTHVETALSYIFPLGLAFYALPALILFARRPVLPAFAPWAIGAGITVILTIWLLPLLQAGWQGQPARYVNYPNAFAEQNLAATTGAILFIATYLALLTTLRRLPAT